MAMNNIVRLYDENQTIDDEVYNQIQAFLRWKKLRSKSQNTAKTYRNGIQSFYEKKIEEITVRDIQGTKLSTFKKYIDRKMDSETISNQTIRNHITAVKELLKYMFINLDDRFPIVTDISYLSSITELTKNLPKNGNYYGRMSVQDVWKMAEWVRVHERQYGDIKYYLILFSLDTCARKEECLSLKWSHFEKPDEHGEVQIDMIGKGNKNFYPKIKEWFYQELIDHLKAKYDSEFVFPINGSSIDRMMKRYRKAFNIPEERRIVFHSIRGTGITFKYHLAGNDMEAARRAANHSNYNTLIHYMSKEDLHADGVVSLSKDVSDDLYKQATQEELIRAIASLPRDRRMEINFKLKNNK